MFDNNGPSATEPAMPALPAEDGDDMNLNDLGNEAAKPAPARKLKKKPVPHYLTGTAASRG